MILKLRQLLALLIIGLMTNVATAQKKQTCDPVKLKHMYTKTEQTFAIFAVVIGLNNTKKQTPIPLDALLESGDVSAVATITIKDSKGKESTKAVKPTKSKTGIHTFENEFALAYKGQENTISDISIQFITKCKDTQVFDALYRNLRKRAKHMRTWEKILSAEAEDVILEGKKNGPNVTAVGFSGTSFTVVNGNLKFQNNAKCLLTINTVAGKGSSARTGMLVSLELKDCKGTTRTQGGTAKLNEKTGLYEWTTKVDASKSCNWTLENIVVTVVNKDKDSTFFGRKDIGTTMDEKTTVLLMKKTGKSKYVDPCETNYILKDISYKEATVSGIYALNFFFDFTNKSDVPTNVAMKIILTDCNGNKTYLSVPIKYDTSSGTYVGSQTIAHPRGCNYTFTYGEVGAYNPCKDKTVWSFDPTTSRSFGKGTRNAATSLSSRPQLL